MGFETLDSIHGGKDGLGQSSARKGELPVRAMKSSSSEVGLFLDLERTQPVQNFTTAS